MAINEKWARWAFASVTKHLLDAAEADSDELVVEMANTRTPTWEAAASQFEATVSGPSILERSQDSYLITVGVFLIVSSLRANGYDHIEAVGRGQKWLNQCIRILDYGDTGAIELATLNVESGADGTLETINLKPTQTDDRLHSTINVQYSARFKAT
jgi:hypothetical protein